MKNGKAVIFTGLDGTGKTAHSDSLVEWLLELGYEVEYQWVRFRHRLTLPFLAVAREVGATQYGEISGYTVSTHRFYELPLALRRLYRILFLLDFFVQANVKVLKPVSKGKIVVCDRYVWDALVDLTISTGDCLLSGGHFSNTLLSLVPRDSITILLDCEPSRLLERRPNYGFDESMPKRRQLYDELKRIHKLELVRTEGPFEAVAKNIQKLVGEFLQEGDSAAGIPHSVKGG